MSTTSMSQIKAKTFLRFSNILRFSAVFSLVIQTIIVSYNVLTGYVVVDSVMEYTGRIVYGSIISTVLALFLILPDIYVIRLMNINFEWNKKAVLRILAEFILTVVIGAVAGISGTTGAHLIHNYKEPFTSVLINNILIASVINLMLITGLEAWFFFRETRISKLKAGKLQEELAIVRFEVLKNQINPHFLFNCLNVLSGLIDTDTKRAQLFIDAFAEIYHYVLETIERQVVTVEEEIGFARSYMFLQKIRHGEQVSLKIELPSEHMKYMLPPLSLQVILENAFKHNNTNNLEISIWAEDSTLFISNNLFPKSSPGPSTGIGQKNLLKRYLILSDRRPKFFIRNDQYIVSLPLLQEES